MNSSMPQSVRRSARRRRTRVLSLIGAHAIVIAIAASAAVASHQADPSVSAANHCTRYAPTPVRVDYDCSVYGSIPGGDWCCQTPSTALRDYNDFLNGSSSTWHQLGYIGGNNYSTPWMQGYGSTIGSSNGYAKAKCGALYGANGACWTSWHD